MDYDYIIWHDNDFDLAFWVKNNSVLSSYKTQLRCIPKTNRPSQILDYFKDSYTRSVMKFIKFETPDLIIQKVDEQNNPVIFVAELMTHTPQWQHPAQRFTRLYNSSILKVATTLIIPQKKTKWERGTKTDYKKTSYVCSPSVYQLFVDATIKNKTPTLIFNWPDKDGYLLYDESHQTSPFIKDDIQLWFNFLNKCVETCGNINFQDFQIIYEKMLQKAEKKNPEDFDTIEGVFKTEDIIKRFNLDSTQLSPRFLCNKQTLVFAPNGLSCKSSPFRTDPYAGMLCAFDIMFCRNLNFERHINLLFIAKNVKISEIHFCEGVHDSSNCPFLNNSVSLDDKHLDSCCFTQAKYRRIYGEISDVIIFDDKIFYNNGLE